MFLTGLSEADIKLQLAEEEDTAKNDEAFTTHDVSPLAMFIKLLELEDQQ